MGPELPPAFPLMLDHLLAFVVCPYSPIEKAILTLCLSVRECWQLESIVVAI